MRKYMIALLLATAPVVGYAQTTVNNTVNNAQLQSYQQQLMQEVRNQEQLVINLGQQNARRDVVTNLADSARFENAVIMLDVKRTLAANFAGAQSLNSPVVRNLLLSIMKQELISPGDLANLQNVVNSEKAKMQAAAPTTTVPVQTTTPAAPATSQPTIGVPPSN